MKPFWTFAIIAVSLVFWPVSVFFFASWGHYFFADGSFLQALSTMFSIVFLIGVPAGVYMLLEVLWRRRL